MKKVEILRKKYPRFVYKSFGWKIIKKNLEISFDFEIPPEIEFRPKIVIKNVNENQIKRVEDRVLNPIRNRKFLNGVNNLVFNLGLIEMLSYWKATCSPEIEIKAGYLNGKQIKWWKDLINRGMGQFFFENKTDFTKPDFIRIKSDHDFYDRRKYGLKKQKFSQNKVLVPVGGGKDSIITLEILKRAEKNITCFSLNPTGAAQRIMKIAGCGNGIIVERKIDKKLLELNQKGGLNGHTPFSAYLAFLSVLCAVLFDFKFIAFSNERSSNEGNLKYLGRVINHQYSKSFDFEEKFRDYSKKYLAKNVEYFSFLRPLYEIQIAKIFSKHPHYFNAFLSCNVAYQTKSGTKKPINPEQIASRLYRARKWCGRCPKCLFVFTALYPFIEESELLKIFRKNLFEDKKLLTLMLELIGERKFKPFECVGTKKESLVAFHLSYKKYRERVSVKIPFLMKYFEEKILTKYQNLEVDSRKIMKSWNNRNNLPKGFEELLKNNIF